MPKDGSSLPGVGQPVRALLWHQADETKLPVTIADRPPLRIRGVPTGVEPLQHQVLLTIQQLPRSIEVPGMGSSLDDDVHQDRP
jgi:hypothetical protein